MKNTISILAVCVFGASLSFACDSTSDSEVSVCSNEISTPAEMGGAGGAATVSCDAPTPPQVTIAISGAYIDSFGGTHEVSSTTWDTGYSQIHFSKVDNEKGYALARNDEGNEYNPCSWSRIVWTESGGNLYYCQAPFNAESECAAEDEDMPDAANLMAGCSGFAWSQLTAQ